MNFWRAGFTEGMKTGQLCAPRPCRAAWGLKGGEKADVAMMVP